MGGGIALLSWTGTLGGRELGTLDQKNVPKSRQKRASGTVRLTALAAARGLTTYAAPRAPYCPYLSAHECHCGLVAMHEWGSKLAR